MIRLKSLKSPEVRVPLSTPYISNGIFTDSTAESDPEAEDFPDYMTMDLDAVLEGSATVEISHGGGEVFELLKEALGKEKRKRLVDSAHF